MVSRRFSSFVLGLVFMFLALMDSLAYTHHEATKKMVVADGISIMAQGVSPSTLEKENFDAEKGKFGGRKMMEKKVLGKEEGMNGGGGSSKISGRTMNVSKKPLGTSEEHMHDQNDTNMSKPKPLGYERLRTSTRSKTSVSQFQSEKLHDHQTTSKIENLMIKDYSGAGIPHPKPPINNYQPLHQHKVVP